VEIDDIIMRARALGCSDVHLSRGLPPVVRRLGELEPLSGCSPLTDDDIGSAAQAMCERSGVSYDGGPVDCDFCYVMGEGLRHRVNLYRQDGGVSAAIRLLSDSIPTLEKLGLPPVLQKICMLPRGLVLVTGPTGSGKSTTLAAMIDYVNTHRRCHILTLEDPIEYKHFSKSCLVSQREIGPDAVSFGASLRAALREDPDVILVGEMRDLETISAAVTAAETGHLVLSTLHTTGAAATIDRLVDVFEPAHQQQIRTQLSVILRAVVSQTLLPKADASGRIAALEIMVVNDAIANMIRDNKCYQINSTIQTGAKLGMQSLDATLAGYVRSGVITMETASAACLDREVFARALSA